VTSPGSVDDGVLDRFNPNRVIIDIQHTSGFTRGRANAPVNWEVVGAMQRVDRVFPVGTNTSVVEVRNDVIDAAVAKRCAAVHAARGLLFFASWIVSDDKLCNFSVLFRLAPACSLQSKPKFSHDPPL
jgi:hypothetical protein